MVRLFLIIFSLALLPRVVQLGSPLWLDEMWSVVAITHFETLWALLFDFKSDNNHLLNSLWVWLVGPSASTTLLRLFSLACGVLAVWLWLSDTERQVRGGATKWLWVPALTFCFHPFFVNYQTEARGYGSAILATYLFLRLFDRALSNKQVSAPFLFFVSVLGLISHPAFLTILFPGLALLVWVQRNERAILLSALLVLLVTATLYFGIWSHWPPSTGLIRSHGEGYFEFASVLFAGPEVREPGEVLFLWAAISAVASILLFTLLLRAAWAHSRCLSVFVCLGMLIFPVLVIELQAARVVYPRYFFPQLVLFVWLLQRLMAMLPSSAKEVPMVRVLALGLLAQALLQTVWMLEERRGSLDLAMAVICDQDTLRSNQPFRAGAILKSWRLSDPEACGSVQLISQETLPDWLGRTIHEEGQNGTSSAQVYIEFIESQSAVALAEKTVSGSDYDLFSEIGGSYLSGSRMAIYRARPEESICKQPQCAEL